MIRGMVVFSKKGRDKGKAMLVLEVDNEYVFLVDGSLRTIEKPKKKKFKHIQPTNTQVNTESECGRAVQNADIRKHLKNYLSTSEGGS